MGAKPTWELCGVVTLRAWTLLLLSSLYSLHFMGILTDIPCSGGMLVPLSLETEPG